MHYCLNFNITRSRRRYLLHLFSLTPFFSAMDALLQGYHHHAFSSPEDSSRISVESLWSTMFPDQAVEEFPSPLSIDTTLSTLGIVDGGMSGFAIEDIRKWLIDDDGQEFTESDIQSPCISLESCGNSQVCLTFAGGDELDADDQRILCHLLRQYAEAMGNGHRELAEVIAKRVLERINPIGEATERVAFHLLQAPDGTGSSYLKEEASKYIEPAFNVLYQSFLYGRFAHFIANQTILENIPDDVESVHIVDFDMGEGVQWPSFIEAIAQKNVGLRLTSIRYEDESHAAPWKLEETKRRLHDHARACGVKLNVEQMSLESLMTELRRTEKRGEGREWTTFNCMIGLPHMGRRRPRGEAAEFLGGAELYLADYSNGMITFGEAGESGAKPSCSYASFFASQLGHYKALFESMESSFPIHLREARIAMESLFVAPYINSDTWYQHWKETEQVPDLRESYGLEGCRVSKESIEEAKEFVNESNSTSIYNVRVEGVDDNELVLEFRGTPLVRVCSWA